MAANQDTLPVSAREPVHSMLAWWGRARDSPDPKVVWLHWTLGKSCLGYLGT
jgi:hypothetical protein